LELRRAGAEGLGFKEVHHSFDMPVKRSYPDKIKLSTLSEVLDGGEIVSTRAPGAHVDVSHVRHDLDPFGEVFGEIGEGAFAR
jgi:hypothetical protein